MSSDDSPTPDLVAGVPTSLQRARHGHADALGGILELCRRYLLQIANTELDVRLQAKVGASDIVQETFLEAQRIFDRFQGDTPDELRAWLRAILLNKMADQDRHYLGTIKRSLEKEVALGLAGVGAVDPEVRTPTPSNILMQREQALALTAALERLPAHYRQVIIWRQIEDMSFEQMAERLERSVEAVRKLWWRAVQLLQVELGKSL